MKNYITAFFFLMLFPSLSFANGIAISGGSVVITDRPTNDSIEDGAQLTFGVLAKANHSYLCNANISSGSSSLLTSITSASGVSVEGQRPSSNEDAIRNNNNIFFRRSLDDSNLRNNQVFFSALNGSDESGRYEMTINVEQVSSFSSLAIQCIDTTTICSFNTAASDFNFLEVTNFGPRDGVAQITTVTFDGTANTSSSAVFPAGLRRDVDIHSLSGPGVFGSVYVQPLNYVPIIDGFSSPKISTYKSGDLTSSVSCSNSSSLFGKF